MSLPSRQRGIAIITAVAVAALVAALAGAMAFRHSLWLHQVQNQNDLIQARGVARAAVDLCRLSLQDDARRNQFDSANDVWAIPIPNLPVEQGNAGGAIKDVQGLFNVNNLVREGQLDEPSLQAFKTLLEGQGLSPDLANAVLDWIDADSETRYPGGAEDLEYLAETPPRRAANRLLFDLDELSQVRGFNSEIVKKLRPYMIALPKFGTKVNVNFAPPEVLAAVMGVNMGIARKLVQQRTTKPFEKPEDVKAALPENVREAADKVEVKTNYFLSDVDARFGRVTIAYRALLSRDADEVPRVVWLRRR
ncbi:type II secretion system minor pseudopilin GspK [Chitinimonas sp. PSY-7]|uniref:type II secretion system minor pseudopilin GspK n=1 Tax=Chitinimonas sp. PSY-7 TaxID=3459088 RepID=UPI0040403454